MKLSDYFPDPAVKPLAEVANWRAAVQLAGDGLEAQGATTAEYTAEMLAAIDDLGPYIVIAPGFALAHSRPSPAVLRTRSEEHTSELQSRGHLVCRLLLE